MVFLINLSMILTEVKGSISFLKKPLLTHGKSQSSFKKGIAESQKNEFTVNDLHTFYLIDNAYLYR